MRLLNEVAHRLNKFLLQVCCVCFLRNFPFHFLSLPLSLPSLFLFPSLSFPFFSSLSLSIEEIIQKSPYFSLLLLRLPPNLRRYAFPDINTRWRCEGQSL